VVGSVSMCYKGQDLCRPSAEEPVLHCSSGFMGKMEGRGQSWCSTLSNETAPNAAVLVRLCTPTVKDRDSRRHFKRFGVFLQLPLSHLCDVLGSQKSSALLQQLGSTEQVLQGKRIACGLMQSEGSWFVPASCSHLPCAWTFLRWSVISHHLPDTNIAGQLCSEPL